MSTTTMRVPAWRAWSLRPEQPVLWFAVALVAMAALVPQQVGPSLAFIAKNLVTLAPALLGSVAIAAYLKAARADALLRRAVGRNTALAVAGASLLGALSPFCSCGVVPIVASLLAAGVPLAPVMAFWISSPLMSPDMFLLTAATLGMEFALAKTAAAIGLGLLAGAATHALVRAEYLGKALADSAESGRNVASPTAPQWAIWRTAQTREVFGTQFRGLGWKLAQWIAIAFLLESLMVAWLPAELLATWLGAQSAWSIPLAVAVGIPAYLNGYAALPLTVGLINAGMAPGAALAFLTAGGVTSIPAIVAVRGIADRSTFALYLTLAVLGSLAAGYGYQLWIAL